MVRSLDFGENIVIEMIDVLGFILLVFVILGVVWV